MCTLEEMWSHEFDKFLVKYYFGCNFDLTNWIVDQTGDIFLQFGQFLSDSSKVINSGNMKLLIPESIFQQKLIKSESSEFETMSGLIMYLFFDITEHYWPNQKSTNLEYLIGLLPNTTIILFAWNLITLHKVGTLVDRSVAHVSNPNNKTEIIQFYIQITAC